MFNTQVITSKGDDIASLVAQIFSDNPSLALKASKLAAKKLDSIVKRSMGKTGSFLFRQLKTDLRKNTFGLKELTRYTNPNSRFKGALMTDVLKANRPWSLSTARVTKSRRKTGAKWANLMQYQLDFSESKKQLEVGLIPERRGGKEWARRFADWQIGGRIRVENFLNYSPSSMFTFFQALGMPISKFPTRPARPIISRVEAEYNPVKLFEQFFIERLTEA